MQEDAFHSALHHDCHSNLIWQIHIQWISCRWWKPERLIFVDVAFIQQVWCPWAVVTLTMGRGKRKERGRERKRKRDGPKGKDKKEKDGDQKERKGMEGKGNQTERKGNRIFWLPRRVKKEKKISGPLGLLITLYAVKIFDVPRLLMSGAMKNA